MTKYSDIFLSLPLPKHQDGNSFSAVVIDDYNNHRIAKDIHGCPCLLIGISINDKRENIPILELYNLKVYYNQLCSVEVGKYKQEKNFTIIKYVGEDEFLKYHFLSICSILLHSLGNEVSNVGVTKIVNRFIELFKSIQSPAKNTIQGIWGELFLINECNNIKGLLEAWHAVPEELYDFGFKNSRIEVKTSSDGKRTHEFSYEQLLSPTNVKVFIASLFVKRLTVGISVLDLVNQIETKINGDFKLIEKLHFVLNETLGEDIFHINSLRFDYEIAKDSFRVFNAIDVPKFKSIPKNFSKIRVHCTFDDIVPIANTPNFL